MKANSRRNFFRSLTIGLLGLHNGVTPGSAENSNLTRTKLPILNEVDICILGGSCTGVFAAVRASRLGARVAIVEKQNGFGGVATNGLVNIWHSLYNTDRNKQIIAGLTTEVIDRLSKREAVISSDKNRRVRGRSTLNTQELKIELDELVLGSGIIPYLHTLFSEPYIDSNGELAGVMVDNKSGRGIIKAKYFIDATGDGDLCERMGLKSYYHDYLQPPTACAHIEGAERGIVNSLVKQHGREFDLPEGYFWGAEVPSTHSYMLAGTRILGVNCAIADELTHAEIEGRRQIRAILDMVRKHGNKSDAGLTSLCSYVGIRETRHIKCLYKVTDDDALYGKNFADAIANCSYPFDVHHQNKPGNTFRFLDGKEIYARPGYPDETRRWREKTATDPTFYQVPLRSLIPQKTKNLIVAGRMLDASTLSFSGIRVMVNMNQTGEAAGVTSYLALNQNKSISEIDPEDVRKALSKGGSIIM